MKNNEASNLKFDIVIRKKRSYIPYSKLFPPYANTTLSREENYAVEEKKLPFISSNIQRKENS